METRINENIVVAGNGPSTGSIDFRRLPQDSRVMRMNNFFFEEKYYIGKTVDYYIEYVKRLENQYFNMRSLLERGEYSINMQNIYMTVMFEANKHFPSVKMATPLMQQNPVIAEFRCFYEYYYGQYLPTGIAAIGLAAMLGFKNIFLAGIDLFAPSSNNYYYTSRKATPVFNETILELYSKDRKIYETGGKDLYLVHPIEMSVNFIKLLINTFPDTKFLSISEKSPINNYIDVAPVLYHTPWYIPEEKPDNAIYDWLLLPETMPGRKNSSYGFIRSKEEISAMKKAVLFGAGTQGKVFYEQLKNQYDILYATDNDAKKYGTYLLPGIEIKDKKALHKGGFDCVIITTYAGFEEVNKQLIEEFQIDENNIICKHVEYPINAKKEFVRSVAKIVYDKKISGAVCEVGVYRGGFAKEINRCFPDRKLYLFDTFEGYDSRDIEIEHEKGFDIFKTGDLAMTSEELVLSVMPYPNQCIIKKGYFPETFDIVNAEFCFVNIDVDLYQPVKAALELFYPHISVGGIILIHDYLFLNKVTLTTVAVDEFTSEHGLGIIPIGDGISVAIVKQ